AVTRATGYRLIDRAWAGILPRVRGTARAGTDRPGESKPCDRAHAGCVARSRPSRAPARIRRDDGLRRSAAGMLSRRFTSMRRFFIVTATALFTLAAIASLSGCGAKQTASDTTASSDSLLASNPVEQPSGSITPQSDFNQQQQQQSQQQQEAPPPSTHKSSTQSVPHKPKTSSTSSSSSSAPAKSSGVRVDAGTALQVSVDTQVSSEHANVGDSWTGTIKENVIVGDRVVFPAGSTVSGVVTEVLPAEQGKLARLGLGVTGVTVNGKKVAVEAGMETIEAGSTRARNLGAIAGTAAAGALIGRAVGGSGKGALIGGLIGGAAAGTAVAKSRGYQVV